ncbi:Transposase IS66 family protein [compost metagenome]
MLVGEKEEENKRWQTWCVATPELVSYRILPSRSTAAAKEVLGDFRGTVVTDGYAAYQSLASSLPLDTGFRLAHCWAHVRRKFVEARDNFPEECDEVLGLIRELYEVEREAKDASEGALYERRARLRAERSRALVARIYEWAARVRALPRSALGQAVSYMVGLKAGLSVFLDDPRVPIDNNGTERALRGPVVGRKNHYGSKSRRGTEVAAIFYTLLESAKLSGVDPKAYLLAVIDRALADRHAVLLPRDFKPS